ncbi:MAG: SRPBCC family protein [Ktedonobacterales bacterium]
MASIRRPVGIAAPQARVYEALTAKDGLAGWWTRQIEGDPNVGGSLSFYFGGSEPGAVMEIAELTPASHVAWNCVRGPDEWVGTHLTFDLTSSENETVVLFAHADWRDPVEFMYHCSTKWAYFLLGMKAWLEGGESPAFPNDLHISGWDDH